jgi:hypothetical protein
MSTPAQQRLAVDRMKVITDDKVKSGGTIADLSLLEEQARIFKGISPQSDAGESISRLTAVVQKIRTGYYGLDWNWFAQEVDRLEYAMNQLGHEEMKGLAEIHKALKS